MFTASSTLFYHLFVFSFSYQSILLYTWLLLTLCPVTILPLATPLTFCISYLMLLTSLIPKQMYSYISENNFEPSNQIIVPTGYTVFILLLDFNICLSQAKRFALFITLWQYFTTLFVELCYERVFTIYWFHI